MNGDCRMHGRHKKCIYVKVMRLILFKMGTAFSTNGAKRNAHRILVEKPEGKSHLEDLDVGGRIILK
jgi:hypothetical protein